MVLRVLFGDSIFLAEAAHTEQGLEKIHTWYIPPMEYYPTIRRNEVLIHATTWANLKNHHAK